MSFSQDLPFYDLSEQEIYIYSATTQSSLPGLEGIVINQEELVAYDELDELGLSPTQSQSANVSDTGEENDCENDYQKIPTNDNYLKRIEMWRERIRQQNAFQTGIEKLRIFMRALLTKYKKVPELKEKIKKIVDSKPLTPELVMKLTQKKMLKKDLVEFLVDAFIQDTFRHE